MTLNPRCLVLGCGSIGSRHVRNLAGLGVHDLVVYDPEKSRLDSVRDLSAVRIAPSENAAWKCEPDAVLVCTPPREHIRLALEAVRNGCDVFIEKPLSNSMDRLDELINQLVESGAVSLVGCNMRFHPGVRALKELVGQERLGRITSARFEVGFYLPSWRPDRDYRTTYSALSEEGGGIILDSIHELDLATWMLGQVTEVACFAAKLSDLEMDAEDTAAFLLRFESGLIGEVHLDCIQRKYTRSCTLIGTRGVAHWSWISGQVSYSIVDEDKQVIRQPNGWEPNDMYKDEMTHFLDCIETRRESTNSVVQASQTLRMALTAKSAAKSRKVQRIIPNSDERVVGIVQARMRSTRLPGKVLADVVGRPMLGHLIDRLSSCKEIDQLVVATSTEPDDDVIEQFCRRENIECFRGSETDVLDRYFRAATESQADIVIRVTGDCPLLDAETVDRAVEQFKSEEFDYLATDEATSIDGLDVEVMSFKVLEEAWEQSTDLVDREHVTLPIRREPHLRRGRISVGTPSLRTVRLSVDAPEDLEAIRSIFSHFYPRNDFGIADLIEFLSSANPSLGNEHLVRNEGYYRSIAEAKSLPAKHFPIDRSLDWRRRSEKVIPSSTQTFSKGPTQYVQGVAPVFLERASGTRVWDVDGNEFIDYAMGLGAVILGHGYPSVTEAAVRQLGLGQALTLPHPLEVSLAELLTDLIPCAEMIRFAKNGSDVTAAAVRAARAITGRDMIVCCGYHGWHDWFIGSTTRSLGVPQATRDLVASFAYNDVAGLEKVLNDYEGTIAAIVMEPVGVEEPNEGFLQRVKNLAHKKGILLVFDEIVTGFRIALGGAQEYFGVVPDIACFGKGMANGFPLSAICGPRDLMNNFDNVFFSSTFGGETASLAAATATIEEIRSKDVVTHLWAQGRVLKDGFNLLTQELGLGHVAKCVGLPPRTSIQFEPTEDVDALMIHSFFQQQCLRRGVLFSGPQNISFMHRDAEIDHTLRVYKSGLVDLRVALENDSIQQKLDGKPIEPIFRSP